MPPVDIDALVANRDVARLQVLAAGPDKALAKAARRGLHTLRTKGVEAETPRVPQAGNPIVVGEVAEAWTGLPDRRGVRLVSLAQPAASGGFDFVHVMLSDEKGLEDVVVGRGPRRVFREARRRFEESGLVIADVPMEYAMALVQKAHDVTRALGRSPAGDYAVARRVFATVKPASDQEIADALAEIPAAELDRAEAEKMHDWPDLMGWLPESALEQLSTRWDEIATSALLLDDAQKQRARLDATDKAIAAAFDDAGRARWQRRLTDAAMVYAAAGKAREAGLCKAQAEKIGAPGFDATTDPWCRRMIEKVLPRAELAPVAEAPGDGGLIVPGR